MSFLLCRPLFWAKLNNDGSHNRISQFEVKIFLVARFYNYCIVWRGTDQKRIFWWKPFPHSQKVRYVCLWVILVNDGFIIVLSPLNSNRRRCWLFASIARFWMEAIGRPIDLQNLFETFNNAKLCVVGMRFQFGLKVFVEHCPGQSRPNIGIGLFQKWSVGSHNGHWQ